MGIQVATSTPWNPCSSLWIRLLLPMSCCAKHISSLKVLCIFNVIFVNGIWRFRQSRDLEVTTHIYDLWTVYSRDDHLSIRPSWSVMTQHLLSRVTIICNGLNLLYMLDWQPILHIWKLRVIIVSLVFQIILSNCLISILLLRLVLRTAASARASTFDSDG